MGMKRHIAKKAAKWLFHEICDSYAGTGQQYSTYIDLNTLYAALDYAEQICRSTEPTCKKEHLALFKSEVIKYIHTK